ncbi:inorganic diphosphatase [Mangrovivirga cuniculi]|uniref:inorganic diphosphatase n=1 Tax=Mangrovivirga cuniculi TaxID=2715131 RepID=A0A4D7JG38_9BACT|nr:inorganic diphosphatase [Mangrovivirga cuniculi]QCK15139.1 inorganic diphosphatase [Mangrovivirga cuniculi]
MKIYLLVFILSGIPILGQNNIEMLVEIPAGTITKYEMNKESGELLPDSLNGKIRIIDFLGYPGNYGFIKNTMLSKNEGGDGDPLDVLLISAPLSGGRSIEIRPIAILKLIDNGEKDDKIIAVPESGSVSNLQNIDSFEEFKLNYPKVMEIIKLWFTNYKGKGTVSFVGWENELEAIKLIERSTIH